MNGDYMTAREFTEKLLRHYPFTYCPTLAAYTQNFTPHRGDVVLFFRNGTYAHTGIVYKVSGSTYYTIEGNTSGASGVIANGGGVCKKQYDISNYPGTKFFRPDYSIVGSADKVIDSIIAVAEAEVGYLEKASLKNIGEKTANAGSANYTKYWDLYPAFQAQPWCAIFVTWCIQHGTAKFLGDFVPSHNKTIDQIAKEVISGKYGVGEERVKLLKVAGYDPDEVQRKVNDLMGVSLKKVVSTSNVRHPWVLRANKYDKILKKDVAKGVNWHYSNFGCKQTMWGARHFKKTFTNCARFICWIFRAEGILKAGQSFYGDHGRIVWKNAATEKAVKEKCDIIDVDGRYTLRELVERAYSVAGDVIICQDITHTLMVTYNGKCYDAGHAYAIGSGEGAKFVKWRGPMVHGNQRVGKIIRLRGNYKI